MNESESKKINNTPNEAYFSPSLLIEIAKTKCTSIVWDLRISSRWIKRILHLWLRASLIYINNCPTRCNTKQSIYYSAGSLYMFRVWNTPIIRSTQNCNYSLRYWSYFLCSYLPPVWPSLATLEEGSCSTGGCSYSFVHSWWWGVIDTRNM